VATGSLEDIIREPRSITGQYLSGVKKIPVPSRRRGGNGKQLKIWEAEVAREAKGDCGTILSIDKESFTIGCKEGGLRVKELQLEGKKRMSTHDFLLGVKVQVGDCLGDK
jgi:methionyl-tRNA formyltransferase